MSRTSFPISLFHTCAKYPLLIMISLAICTNGLAQKSGKLTGKIMDASNNEPLSGVSITPKNNKSGVTSITDGTYIFSLLPGIYTIRYSFTGFKTKEITELIIKANETTFQDILLETANEQLAEVVVTVTAKKESQSSVYSIQKRSSAASDGISIEAINRTPDNNAGQILTRVTGVNMVDNKFIVVRGLGEQYNQTMLNGVPMTSTESNRNAFSFDLIPAAAIDNIVINKTATPDMPGSFAGGVVQISTKDFPAKDFLSLALQVGLSDETYGKNFYSDEKATFQFLGFDGGIRDLPKGFPSNADRVPFVNLNYQEQVRLAGKLNNNLVPINQGPSGLNEQVQIGVGKNINFRNSSQLGIVASFNQRKTQIIEKDFNVRNPEIGEEFFLFPEIREVYTKVPVASQWYAINDYSENIRYRYAVDLGGVVNIAYRFNTNKITLKNLFTQVYNNQFVDRPVVFEANYNFRDTIRNYQQIGFNYLSSTKRLINSVLGGEHRTGAKNETRIDWNISSTFNLSKIPDTRSFIFGADSTRKFIGIDDNSAYSLKTLLQQASRTWNTLDDVTYSGGFNITTPFMLFKQKQLFKGGFLFQNRARKNRAAVVPYSGMTGTIDSILSYENLVNGNTKISIGSGSIAQQGGDYNAGSSLFAIYESVENKFFEKLRVIWGLRIEKYQQSSNIFQPLYFEGFQQVEPAVYNFASRTDFHYLPSINVIYSPRPSLNVRAAYSNTVIRPDLKDIIAIPTFDLVNFRLTQGNPELLITSIQNYDLKLEWFPSAGEIISIAAFYKKLHNPIEYVIPDGTTLGLQDLSGVPVNTGRAYVQGIEMELRKKINFISGLPWLKSITLFGNGTLLKSKVHEQSTKSLVITKIFEHTLTGQSPYILNAGINILALKNTFELTLSFNKTGDYIGELGTFQDFPIPNSNFPNINFTRDQRIPNYYLKARNLADIVMSKSFHKTRAKLKLNISNLFSEPYILYQDLNNNKRFDEALVLAVGPNKRGGVILPNQAGMYQSGTDNTATKVLGQRTYSLAFSYTF